MIILDKLYTWIMNHFLTDEDFDPNNVICSIDDKPVNCETWEDATNDNY